MTQERQSPLGISGRIAGFFESAQITPLVALVALLLLLKSRPNSTSFFWPLARRRLKSSRSSAQLPAWASRKPRIWWMALRSPSRKPFPRLMQML